MRTTIHLMRHGEVFNPQRLLYGRKPGFGLSALGKEMAFSAAEAFVTGNHDIAQVVASPLLRAQQTALPTAGAFGLPVQADSRLVEAANVFEGADIAANRWQLAYPRNWRFYSNPFQPSWGEPYLQILERMRAVIAECLRENSGREVVLVSHQLPIWTVRSWVEGWSLAHLPFQRECSLASVTSLIFEGATLVGCYYWEPAGHLLPRAADMVPGTSAAHLPTVP